MEKFCLNRFPEPFDFSKSHRVMGAGFDMLDTILFQFPFKPRAAAPVGILSAIVGEHLTRHTVLADGSPVGLKDVFSRLAVVKPRRSAS